MYKHYLSCPNCGWSGVIDTYRYDENIFCPDCCELIEGYGECPCKDCSWNDDGYCLIEDDDLVTFGEDCPYRNE